MLKKILSAVLALSLVSVIPAAAESKPTETVTFKYGDTEYTREMEKLGRGLTAVRTGSGVFLSWRLLASEASPGYIPAAPSFNVYRDGKLIASVTDSTNYTDTQAGESYSVAPVFKDGSEGEKCAETAVLENPYIEIPLQKPAPTDVEVTAFDKIGNALTADPNYYVGDASAGDLDGDGVPDEEFLTLGIDFAGSVDGGNKVISGVGKPLFESVSGSVRKLNLVLAVSESGSTEFGAVARRLSQGANIIRVTVTGTVEIRGDASSEIVFGGIAACSEGATIGGADFGADVVIRGGTVIYGGIAGIGDAPNGDHAKTWNVQSVSRADIGGVSLSAGKYIGIMRGGASVTFTASSAELKLNNVVSEMNVGKTISG